MPVSRKAQISIFVMLILLGIASIVTLLGAFSDHDPSAPTWETQSTETTLASTTAAAAQIPVYLVGEVQCPGIYHVKRGTYLYELVEHAGGLTDAAAADRTNLVFQIEGSQLIRIPSTSDENPTGLGYDPVDLAAPPLSLVNINTAAEAELVTLPGIGPVTARAIISFRAQNGLFGAIEEIMNVPGIKQSRFEAIRDAITT